MPRRKRACERNAEIIRYVARPEPLDIVEDREAFDFATPVIERYQRSWIEYFTIDGPRRIDLSGEGSGAYFNSFTFGSDT